MSNVVFARDTGRLGLYLPLGNSPRSAAMVVPFYKMDRSELDEIVRAHLETEGITDESHVQAVCDEAEVQYEQRRKTEEARKELRRLMEIRAKGGKLMRTRGEKWLQAFYPATKQFKE